MRFPARRRRATGPIDVPLVVEATRTDSSHGIGGDEVIDHIAGVMADIRTIRDARHGPMAWARLAPTCGRMQLCAPLRPGRRAGRRSVRALVETDPLAGDVLLRLRWPDGSIEEVGRVRVARPSESTSVLDEITARLWRAAVPDLPFAGWEPLAAFMAAVARWTTLMERGDAPASADVSDLVAALRRALDGHPRNPIVRYNLGALLYTRYDEPSTHEAIKHFSIAFSATFERTDTEIALVAGQALTGLSLCYAQLHHRFGHRVDEVVARCRITAARAVEVLEGLVAHERTPVHTAALLRARYAQAFSWHVTDRPEDVAKAIAVYEEVVAGWDDFGTGAPAVILNNLGYQYMTLEGRDEPGPDLAAYEHAAALFRQALDREPRYEMAWANLGNVQRLMRQYDEAEASYRAAMDAAASQGKRYPPAHVEIARLLLETGDAEGADTEYRVALSLADSPAAQAKIHGEYADACKAVNLTGAALDAATAGLALRNDEPRCLAVYEALRPAPSPAGGGS